MKVIQPRPFNLRKTIVVGSVVFAFILWHILRPAPRVQHPAWRGPTMGTYYAVKLANTPLPVTRLDALRGEVDALLDRLNGEFSTYLEDSAISRFNASESTAPFNVSTGFVAVTRAALDIAARSQGAFDPTIGPLVERWGFGSKAFDGQDPSTGAIARALASCGYQKLEVVGPTAVRKKHPRLQLDLNALAKGYAADQVLSLLGAHGFTNAYVEIGGDCLARGVNPRGTPWTIGIETPGYGAALGQALQSAVELTNRAIATSGDYRNYRESAEGFSTHIINPATGQPVGHTLASVTVMAPDGMTADALATALFVMGAQKGIAWVETLPGTDALFILRGGSNRFEEVRSPGFQTLPVP